MADVGAVAGAVAGAVVGMVARAVAGAVAGEAALGPVSSAPAAVTMLSTAAAALAATRAALVAAEPRMGLLVLNSRHFAPSTIIILDTAIFGFFAAIRGLAGEIKMVMTYFFIMC